MNIEYNQCFGPETLLSEYKISNLQSTSIANISIADAEKACITNHFKYNNEFIESTLKNSIYNGAKYLCGYLNMYPKVKLNGHLNIGMDDFGYVCGIPYQGKFPIDILESSIRSGILKNIHHPYLSTDDFDKIIKINFIKINNPPMPDSRINPKFEKYLKKKEKHNKQYKRYIKRLDNWRIRFDFANQKLTNLVNNEESRIILIEYIQSIDPINPVIQLLRTDYVLRHVRFESIIEFKQDTQNIYYWVTKWKDYMIQKLRKEKPIFTSTFSQRHTPINLLVSSSDMIPYWMNYNHSMNLYMIHIEYIINPIQYTSNEPDIYTHKLCSYYDEKSNQWLQCYRTIDQGNPVCLHI
jgi:hypothetical protein